MQKQTVIGLIKSRLGNRTDAGIDTRIAGELDAAQTELELYGDFVPWFLLSDEVPVATVVGAQEIALPSDMLQEWEDGAVAYDYLPVTKYEHQALQAKYQDSVGEPKAYAMLAESFKVFPIPDAIYTLKLRYYQKDALPSTLAAAGENRWLKYAPMWLLAKAGVAVARYIKDAEATAMFQADAAAAREQVYKAHVARAEHNVERQMGDD